MEKNVARVAPMTQMAPTPPTPAPAASRGSLMPSRRKRKAASTAPAPPPTTASTEPLNTKQLTAPREVMSGSYNRGGVGKIKQPAKPKQQTQQQVKRPDRESFLKVTVINDKLSSIESSK